jgi:hypothetical protein
MAGLFSTLALALLTGCGALESGAAVGSVTGASADKEAAEQEAAPTVAAAGKSEDAKGSDITPAAKSDVPPLYFFYTVHGHQGGENLPYSDEAMTRLDQNAAKNFVAAIEAISSTCRRYGVKVTWELVSGTAKGIAEYQGKDNIFQQMVARGDEIGMHTHNASRVVSTTDAVNRALGMIIQTGSGVQMSAIHAGGQDPRQAVADHVKVMVDAGLTQASVNLTGTTRSPLAEACDFKFGEGNDMWERTHSLLFPFKPDYKNGNPCKHNPSGDFMFIDHTDPSWLLANGKSDTLTDAQFNELKRQLDEALDYMEKNKPDRPASWGFVTHFSEYARGNKGGPVQDAPVAALDKFLSYVDSKAKEGRIRYATVSEIAEMNR